MNRLTIIVLTLPVLFSKALAKKTAKEFQSLYAVCYELYDRQMRLYMFQYAMLSIVGVPADTEEELNEYAAQELRKNREMKETLRALESAQQLERYFTPLAEGNFIDRVIFVITSIIKACRKKARFFYKKILDAECSEDITKG